MPISGQLIYLASPYSHADPKVRQQRFEQACCWASLLMDTGLLVFSPIAHSHYIAVYGELKTGWSAWERFDRVMLSKCDRLVILPLDGWTQSEGIKKEVDIWRDIHRDGTGARLEMVYLETGLISTKSGSILGALYIQRETL